MGLEPHVKLGIWTNGKDIATVQRNIKGELVPNLLGHVPFPTESLTEGADKPLFWKDLEPNVSYSELRRYFERNANAVEVLIMKGTRTISVIREDTLGHSFIRNFMMKYRQK